MLRDNHAGFLRVWGEMGNFTVKKNGMVNKAVDIEEAILSMADPERARWVQRYFRTGPGGYGEGDTILGVSNPNVRLVVKEAWRDTSLPEAAKLVLSPLHEVRLCGLLILVEQYMRAMKRKDAGAMDAIFNLYLSLHQHINNWDLVDLSATKIVGNHEVLNPEIDLMDRWIQPEGHTMWQQRIAMVSTWMLTRNGRPECCLRRAKTLMSSPHDLLYKAAGWMLREVWKKGYFELLRDFLAENVAGMPSVMLSYACEKMSPDERHHWQALRKEKQRRVK